MKTQRSRSAPPCLPASLSAAARRRQAVEQTPTPPRQKWSFAGPFGKFDRGAAAARLQGLQGSLLGLPRAEHAVVPQSRRSGRAGLHRGAGRRDRRRIQDPGRSTIRARCSSAPGRLADHFPSPFPNELAAQRDQRRRRRPTCRCSPRRAATSAASPGSSSTSSRSTRSRASDYIAALLTGYKEAAGRLHAAAGRHYNEYFPGHAHRDAAAAAGRAGRLQRRLAADGRSIRQGRRGLPDVGGRAAPGGSASASASR